MLIARIMCSVVLLCAGCVRNGDVASSKQLLLGDALLRAREMGQNMAVQYPQDWPYHNDVYLRNVYLAGFKHGWNVGVKYGTGVTIGVPTEFGADVDSSAAWNNGFGDGLSAGDASVRKIARSLTGSAPDNGQK
jgi:hypothetical protein